MADNVKVVATKNKIKSGHIIYTKQIDLGKIKKDLFIPEHMMEDFIDKDSWKDDIWKELDGEYFVNIISLGGDTIYVALNDFSNDSPEYVYTNKDGSVCASSMLPVPDLEGEHYYAGDESMEIGVTKPFESVSKWLWEGISEVYHSEQLSLKGETLKYLLKEET